MVVCSIGTLQFGSRVAFHEGVQAGDWYAKEISKSLNASGFSQIFRKEGIGRAYRLTS